MIPGTEVTYVSRGDVQLAVTHAGSGPVVLLLHGFPELAYSWRAQFAPLAAAGLIADCVPRAGSAKMRALMQVT